MTTTTESVEAVISDARRQWDQKRRNIRLLSRVLGIGYNEMGKVLSMSRSLVWMRLSGDRPLRPGEPEGFAEILGVPPEVLDYTEPDLLRWLADHRQEALAAIRCSSRSPSVAA